MTRIEGKTMFLRILKKDLKRKKTMNVILLIFVILCSTFAAASVNNIIAVTGGLDYYFEKAGMADYYLFAHDGNGEGTVENLLETSANVKDWRSEKMIDATSEALRDGENKFMDFSNVLLICDISDTNLNFFDRDNNIVSDVPKGKVYITGYVPIREGATAGDKFRLKLDSTEIGLEVEGIAKDALFGSAMMANPRLLMNHEDFETLLKDETISTYRIGHIYYIDSDDTSALESDISGLSDIYFSGSNAMIKTTYIMNTLVAMVILVISIGLIIVSFVVLKFTIRFTISEEFREIGVMKAVGLPNTSIRSLYIVKYFGIAIVGAGIGYVCSIPFGKMLINSISQNMMLGNDNSIIVSILCCIAVVLLILLFSWQSTRKVNKLSPIDAVRNGQTGERFGKKSILHLGKSKLLTSGFFALNDVVSEPKQYGILTAVFAVCTSMVMILAVTANTLNSDSLLYLLSVTNSDVYMSDSERAHDVMTGIKTLEETETEIEDILAEHDMPGTVYLETWYKLPVTSKNENFNIPFLKCKDTKTTDYEYTDGIPPMCTDEIAVTEQIADKLNAHIGDHVTVNIGDEKKEFIITAYFQDFNNLGECARFHQDLEIPDTLMSSAFSYQINFDDAPDDALISERIEKMKKIFDNENIMDTTEFVMESTSAGETIRSVKNLVLAISTVIIILLAVLMERSFITKEKAEIALMKAVGFSDGAVILHHTLRFTAIALIAIMISSALLMPLMNLIIDPIFGRMGATGKIAYQINAAEIFGLYPVIILTATVTGTLLTALCTKIIKASDTASIE